MLISYYNSNIYFCFSIYIYSTLWSSSFLLWKWSFISLYSWSFNLRSLISSSFYYNLLYQSSNITINS